MPLGDLRNRGQLDQSVRQEFEHLIFQLNGFLDQIFDANGNFVQADVYMPTSIIAIRHENVSFGSTETTHTADVHSFPGFEDAAEDEVFFEFHGPDLIKDTASFLWSVALDPTTFPTVTFRKEDVTVGGTASSANLPASVHYWSMWRRRT